MNDELACWICDSTDVEPLDTKSLAYFWGERDVTCQSCDDAREYRVNRY